MNLDQDSAGRTRGCNEMSQAVIKLGKKGEKKEKMMTSNSCCVTRIVTNLCVTFRSSEHSQ